MQENARLSESMVIQEGLDKLAVYRDRTNLVPAYAVAMSTFILLKSGLHHYMILNLPTVLNPSQKLQYYTAHEPQKLAWAKGLLRETVSAPLYLKT